MTWFTKSYPLWLRFLLFNVMSVVGLWWTGRLTFDRQSIVSLIIAFALMNYVGWLSWRSDEPKSGS